jgi:molybdopterin synthase catalytic subunit
MSNPMRYIKDLEAAGFKRDQAEAQVQMVLDAIEGDLVTKSDFVVYQERVDNRFNQMKQYMDARFDQVDARFAQMKQYMDARFTEMDNRFEQIELRIVTRLGVLIVSTTSIAVAVLAWLIKV